LMCERRETGQSNASTAIPSAELEKATSDRGTDDDEGDGDLDGLSKVLDRLRLENEELRGLHVASKAGLERLRTSNEQINDVLVGARCSRTSVAPTDSVCRMTARVQPSVRASIKENELKRERSDSADVVPETLHVRKQPSEADLRPCLSMDFARSDQLAELRERIRAEREAQRELLVQYRENEALLTRLKSENHEMLRQVEELRTSLAERAGRASVGDEATAAPQGASPQTR
jgi:hypothetical protein